MTQNKLIFKIYTSISKWKSCEVWQVNNSNTSTIYGFQMHTVQYSISFTSIPFQTHPWTAERAAWITQAHSLIDPLSWFSISYSWCQQDEEFSSPHLYI